MIKFEPTISYELRGETETVTTRPIPALLKATMPTTIPADKETVAVVGGGLVGALTAIMLHRRGFTVHLFEGRLDWREDARRAVDKVANHSCKRPAFVYCSLMSIFIDIYLR